MSNAATQMTGDEIERLANELRGMLQQKTCCPGHANEALLLTMAGFALDAAGNDNRKAARLLEGQAKETADQLRAGDFAIVMAH